MATDQLQVVKFSYLELAVPVPYQELTSNDCYGIGHSQSFLDSCITTVLKVCVCVCVYCVSVCECMCAV